jgi:hypothetical protein
VNLFHGSNRKIIGIDLEKCRPFKDFGKGFYTTPFQNHAWTMARRTVKIYGSGTPWVTEFSFDEKTLKDDKHDTLNVRRFDKPDNEWALFVTNNRNRKFHDYKSPECNGDGKYDVRLVREPGWFSNKSCKMQGILLFSAEFVRKLKFPNNSITGPVANDDIAALINTFLSGIISEDALRRELTFRELSIQYSFHTKRAIALLHKTGAYYE